MTLDFGGVQVSSPAQPLIRLTFFWSAHDGQKMCEYDSRVRGEVIRDTDGASGSTLPLQVAARG
jgi:hypothetical protein